MAIDAIGRLSSISWVCRAHDLPRHLSGVADSAPTPCYFPGSEPAIRRRITALQRGRRSLDSMRVAVNEAAARIALTGSAARCMTSVHTRGLGGEEGAEAQEACGGGSSVGRPVPRSVRFGAPVSASEGSLIPCDSGGASELATGSASVSPDRPRSIISSKRMRTVTPRRAASASIHARRSWSRRRPRTVDLEVLKGVNNTRPLTRVR